MSNILHVIDTRPLITGDIECRDHLPKPIVTHISLEDYIIRELRTFRNIYNEEYPSIKGKINTENWENKLKDKNIDQSTIDIVLYQPAPSIDGSPLTRTRSAP